jgi:hypothetical protein
MLFIFRKLRRSFFLPGKVRTYVAYAIGEIFLIVVGIMIALQLGEWSQNRQNAKEELRILQDLANEIQFNRFLQKEGSKRMETVHTAAEHLLLWINHPEDRPEEEKIALEVHKLTWNWMSRRSSSMYETLNSSGDFDLISSHELRKRLFELKTNQEILFEFEVLQFNFVDSQLRPFLNRSVDRTAIRSVYVSSDLQTSYHPSPFTTSYEDLLLNREFANILTDLIYMTKRVTEAYGRIEIDLNNSKHSFRTSMN